MSDRDLEAILSEPGPGQYHAELERSTSGFSFGPPSPSRRKPVALPEPGPGEYKVEVQPSRVGGAFSYSIRQSTTQSTSPGPKYELPPAVGPGNSPAVSFGTAAQRPAPTTLSNRTPGPQYFLKDDVAKPTAPSVSFGTSKRPPLSMPTAGEAAPFRIGTGAAVSPIKKSSPAFSFGSAREGGNAAARLRVNVTPGPGEYQPKPTVNSPSATIGGRGSRRNRVRQSDIGPGPGSYALPTALNTNRGPSFGRPPRDRKARMRELLKERSRRPQSAPQAPDSPASSASGRRPRSSGRRRR